MSANPRYFTPSEEFHVVQKGDSLISIAQKYSLSKDKLILFNNLKNEKIFLGQRIYLIPKPEQWNQYITVRDIPEKGYHVVRPKENIYLIARMYDQELLDLIDINDLPSFNPKTGEKIYLVRDAKPEKVSKPINSGASLATASVKPQVGVEDFVPLPKMSSTLTLPVIGTVTSEFGMRDGRPHKGIDIANKKGTPILAVAAGKVAFAGSQRGYGNVVIVEHDNSIMTVYAHNEANLVRVGEIVKQSQPIATLGNSGVSTGPHLHFEYRKKGRAVNPRDVLPNIKK